jgi:hypothetical protein
LGKIRELTLGEDFPHFRSLVSVEMLLQHA